MSVALRTWLQASRPKTLPAALAPVVMGVAMAVGADDVAWLPALATLTAALLIQVGTNFANDYFDGVKGTDTEGRLGPQRVVQAGLVSAATMRNAFVGTFALAVLVGTYLVWRGGWPVVGIGVLSVVFGILYTGGPRPLGYLGLGDILVLVFFGPLATGGTYYLQTGSWDPAAVLAGFGPGLLAVALLTVNNLRDLEGDRKAGKRTLAVRFGAGFAKAEFVLCILGAAVVPVLLWQMYAGPPATLAASATCAFGVPAMRAVLTWRTGARLTRALAGAGGLLVLYAVAFSLGWAL